MDPLRTSKAPLRLRTKLAVGVLLVLVPILVAEVLFARWLARSRMELVLQDLDQTARIGALLIGQSFADVLAIVRELGVSPAVSGEDALNDVLAPLVRYRKDIRNAAVFDLEGKVVASVVESPATTTSVLDRQYFAAALRTGEPQLSNLLIGRVSGTPTMVAASAVRGEDGPAGVVAVALDLGAIRERLAGIGLRSEQAIFLVDPSGTLAFHTGADLPGTSVGLRLNALTASTPTVMEDFSSPVGGRNRLAAFAPVEDSGGWVVGVTWSHEAALGPMQRAQRMQYAGVALVALLAFAATMLLSAYFTRPVEKLVEHARILGAGNLDHRLELAATNELARLAAAFNQLADDLRRERKRRQTFISAVSHDLNNLLGKIKLSAELASRDGPPGRMDVISRHTARAAVLVSDLQLASQIEAGLFTIRTRPLDLAELVRRTVADLQATTAEHRFEVEAPDRLDFEGDPVRLAQLVENLAGNAVKYSPPGTVVTVSLDRGDTEVSLRVRDQGRGIAGRDLEHLFEAYNRGAGPGDVPGLGLGLFIVRAITEAHRGRCWAQSGGEGQGATFTCSFPRPGHRPA